MPSSLQGIMFEISSGRFAVTVQNLRTFQQIEAAHQLVIRFILGPEMMITLFFFRRRFGHFLGLEMMLQIFRTHQWLLGGRLKI